MQERRNYYRILGVQPDAPIDVIRGAYRTLMQKLRRHPDLGGDERDAAIINEAWGVLRDPLSRDEYDRQLLSDYDIRLLASGGNPQKRPVLRGATTRRNYYRILGVQSDAPQALIDSAYRATSGDDSLNKAMMAEAYSVLGDPDRRRQYDVSPDSLESETPEAVTLEPGAADSQDAYCPLIRTFCVFCKTPHSSYPGRVAAVRCFECHSPLRRLDWDSNRGDRSFRRLDLTGAVSFYEYWPGTANHGQLNEFTPEGLRLTAQKSLEPGQVVRVSAAVFDAVARVVHCVRCDAGFSSGMELITADFAAHGVFVDVTS